MTTVTAERQTTLRLADDALLRAAAYIDDGWLTAGPPRPWPWSIPPPGR